MPKDRTSQFTLFLPGSRVLSELEIQSLPEEKRKSAEAVDTAGVWVELPCPEGSCVESEGRITIDAIGAKAPKDRGVWLNIFCPEDRCLFESPTDLP
jgi:hypothetical protein